MIVYVESNFVLELALDQEEAASARNILQFVSDGAIELEFPAFALSEPFWTIRLRGKKRLQLSNSINEQFKQLRRSQSYKKTVSKFQPLPIVLAEIEGKEYTSLGSTVEHLLQVGKPIEMDLAVFRRAFRYEKRYGLSPQDSIVYSSVIGSLQHQNPSEVKCFANRNWKDFRDPGIISELKSYNCQYEETFKDALSFIKRNLPSK